MLPFIEIIKRELRWFRDTAFGSWHLYRKWRAGMWVPEIAYDEFSVPCELWTRVADGEFVEIRSQEVADVCGASLPSLVRRLKDESA